MVIKKYHSMCNKNGVNFIIIGDKKTPQYSNKYNFKVSKQLLPLNKEESKQLVKRNLV